MKLTQLVIGQVVLLVVVTAVLVRILVHHRRAKRLQQALLDEVTPTLAPGQSWFRVNLSRPDVFARRWKFVAFEAKGLLIDLGDTLRAVAVVSDGRRIDRQLPKSSLRWLGNPGLAAGNLYWLQIGEGADALMLTADTGLSALPSREATADILRVLAPQQPLEQSALSDFALEKNGTTRVVVAISLTLFLGLLANFALNERDLLSRSIVLWMQPLFGLLVLPLYLLLSRRGVPGKEALWLTLFMAVLVGHASVPVAMHLDAMLAGGAAPTRYVLTGPAHLVSAEPGPPDVRMRDIREYWDQFDTDSEHTLDIVHGPLGLWQLDRSRLNALTRDFYARRDPDAKPSADRPASK